MYELIQYNYLQVTPILLKMHNSRIAENKICGFNSSFLTQNFLPLSKWTDFIFDTSVGVRGHFLSIQLLPITRNLFQSQ